MAPQSIMDKHTHGSLLSGCSVLARSFLARVGNPQIWHHQNLPVSHSSKSLRYRDHKDQISIYRLTCCRYFVCVLSAHAFRNLRYFIQPITTDHAIFLIVFRASLHKMERRSHTTQPICIIHTCINGIWRIVVSTANNQDIYPKVMLAHGKKKKIHMYSTLARSVSG